MSGNRVELKLEVFMGIASLLSLLGTCDRKQVGAVFVRDGRCITWGYNGAPPGLLHCNENTHGWFGTEELRNFAHPNDIRPIDQAEEEIDLLVQQFLHLHGCRNATHAEANALAFAARQGISVEGASLFVTVSPCEPCSRLLIAAGVSAVYYREVYRDGRGVELLHEAGITNFNFGHEIPGWSLQGDNSDRGDG